MFCLITCTIVVEKYGIDIGMSVYIIDVVKILGDMTIS